MSPRISTHSAPNCAMNNEFRQVITPLCKTTATCAGEKNCTSSANTDNKLQDGRYASSVRVEPHEYVFVQHLPNSLNARFSSLKLGQIENVISPLICCIFKDNWHGSFLEDTEPWIFIYAKGRIKGDRFADPLNASLNIQHESCSLPRRRRFASRKSPVCCADTLHHRW